MLEVLIDKYGITKKGEIILTLPKEYARFWDRIIEFINNESKEVIVLRHPYLETYFHNLKEKFGNKIEIEQISPHSEWKKLLGFKLPHGISDEEIADFLLSEKIEQLKEIENKKFGTLCVLSGVADFSDFVIEECIMECILKNAEKKYLQLLTDIIDERAKSLPVGKREFWQRLKEERNKKETLLDAMRSFVVSHYPLDSMLYEKYYKESLTYSGFEFPARLSHYINEDFRGEIKDYLNKHGNNVLSFISGKLKEEWEVVCGFLKENPIQKEAIISSLLGKALGYQDIYDEIRKYRPVFSPPAELNEENMEDWIERYFAFYLYTRQIGKPEDTEKFVKIFEDFILRHYLGSTDFFTQHSVLTVRQKIEENLKLKRKLLVLVIDGLSYAYYKEMERIFGAPCSFLFSTLPTVTEINKQRILSGLLDLKENYNEIAEKFYGEYHWEESNSNKCGLKDFFKRDYDLFIYWENQFDNYIHQPMTFEKRFGDHVEMLNRISKDIESFLDDGGVVLLLGDHGYTTLPQNEANKIDFFNEKVEITHSRVLEVKNGDKKAILSINNAHWIGDNVAIAQCYHYFDSLPRGATHGGATPEEIIVPFFIIEKEKEKLFNMLNFDFLEKKYLRKKKHTTTFIMDNPNAYEVKINSIQFKPSILKIYSPLPILLKSGKNTLEAELDLRFITTEDCKVFIEYMVNEKVYQDSFKIHTTGAIKETFDEWE